MTMTTPDLLPTLASVQSLTAAAHARSRATVPAGPDSGDNKTIYVPVYATLDADLLTPVTAYLKLAHGADYSFLLESVQGGEKIGRYSFLGANPYEILVTGDGAAYRVHGDPLLPLERELAAIEFVPVDGLPSFTGGAVGFIAFDCIQYFEPKTRPAVPLADPLGLPDAVFMFCDSLVVFDHLHHRIQVVTHVQIPVATPSTNLASLVSLRYAEAQARLAGLLATLSSAAPVPLPMQLPIPPKSARPAPESNVGKDGYMSFVRSLQHHIVEGDIFQAVPSQRMRKPTALHPFNAYRQLRSFNPSPYMFYLDLKDFQLVGASPEMLAKVDKDRTVYTHPIAGTRKRGATASEDKALEEDLLADPKERAEHIMLVDLGRNDVNRVCDPDTVTVESLMHIERYSHVMHIVSVVSGTLRPEQTRFTAFRSIFPAGTVSGSPKVKAIELIRKLEGQKRGVYAGAVGHFDYSGTMDTAIAIRTMVFKDGVAYLQAGGGIVFDSNQEDEYLETINKMMSSVAALERAEEYYYQLQQRSPPSLPASSTNGTVLVKPAPPVLKTFAPNQLPTLTSANDIYNLSTTPLDASAPITLLIDNYDSFVFNVYQYLSAEGANVVVYRNDQITLAAIQALATAGTLRNIVISPGPGHPADSGISPAVIRTFAGRVPILGVCLGEQAMFHVWGGTVTYAGSVVHGKTSPITHDGRGLYRGLPQHFNVTRYHSLAGDDKTLPACLEITSWTADGHVMGVRHKQFTVEGVQYHPESVMSEHGRAMIKNFLGLQGGTWADNDPSYLAGSGTLSRPASPSTSPSGASKKETILEQIYRQRKLDVDAAMQLPGKSLAQLRALVAHGAAPAPVDLFGRLTQAKHAPAVMAEVKRASPSKGMIDGSANAGLRALEYAHAGAAVISVLTEPTWFKGTLADLKEVVGVLTTAFGTAHRPAVLRKDFVFCEYQLLEARLAGADAVLLIVAMLNDADLARLLRLTRVLGMEALVEVNNADEMHRALAVGARVIGVNNRNLHTFDVDMGTTSAVASLVPEGVVLCALSGIFCRKDVEPYLTQGVHAVLVGEALMKAKDRAEFMRDLWGVAEPKPIASAPSSPKTLIKICGLKTKEHALAAAQAGANMLGFIFVPGTKRYIAPRQVRDIVRAVRGIASEDDPMPPAFAKSGSAVPCDLASIVAAAPGGRPLTVGVFQNASREDILAAVRESGVDLIQLHGNEDPDLATYLPLPVIKVFRPSDSPALIRSGAHVAALLDSAVGGSGQPFDWAMVPQLVGEPEEDDHVVFVLAGGLHPGNVGEAIRSTRPVGVDVSSGVEVDGVKNVDLIKLFIDEVKQA